MLKVVAWLILLANSTAGDPPTDAQVLRAMSKPLFGVVRRRDNIYIVKERLAPEFISIPLFRNASVNAFKESWKCTVYYDYIIPLGPNMQLRNPQMEVLR